MREEPSSMRGEPRSVRGSNSTQEYFLPSEGISEIVIKEYITRYRGTGAEVTTVMSKVCGKPEVRGILIAWGCCRCQ
jgi:hypothetical protein